MIALSILFGRIGCAFSRKLLALTTTRIKNTDSDLGREAQIVTERRLRMGMVGGGQGAFIGDVHR